MKASDIMAAAKQYIRDHSSEDEWAVLSLVTICTELNIPNHVGRTLISKLRLEPDVRTKLRPTSARFKSREFYMGTPEEKIQDIKSNMKMFEITEEENKLLVSDFKKFLNQESLSTFLTYMYVCERFKNFGAHKKWIIFNPFNVANSIEVPVTLIDNIVSELILKHIIVKSPYTSLYRLTISDEEYNIISDEVKRQSIDPNCSITDNISADSELDNINNGFLSTVKTLIEYNGRIGKELKIQMRLLEGLEKEKETFYKQKIVFNRLNLEYQKLLEEKKKTDEELKNAKDEIEATDIFLGDYQKQIINGVNDLAASLTSTLENYFRLPQYKKNDMTINNAVKVQLTSVIMEYQKNILKYRKEKN